MTTSRALMRLVLAAVLVLAAGAALAQTYRLTTGLGPDDYLGDVAVTPEGRYVAYCVTKADYTQAGRLVLIDRLMGTERRIDRSTAGDYSSAYCPSSVSISDDARYVVYTSRAPNLVPGDTNDATDVFLFDTATNQTARVSYKATGAQLLFGASRAQISGNGRYIAFETSDADVVPGLSGGSNDVFVYDRIAGTNEWISHGAGGTTGSGQSWYPSISRDGNVVVFLSTADNLVPGDTGYWDIMARNRTAGTIARVSVSSTGAQANADNYFPTVSANGRYVVFKSKATNLVSTTLNGLHYQVFRHDIQTGQTVLVSVNSAGEPAQGDSQSSVYSAFAYMSEDGRYVAFPCDAANMGGTDTNASFDLFIRDVDGGKTYPVSVRHDGTANAGCFYSGNAYSADGRFACFQSSSTAVVQGDTDWHHDLFIRDMGPTLGITGVSISGVAPPSAENSGPVTLTVSGSGFVAGATVKLTRSGQTDILGTSVSVAPDGKTITATLDLAGKLRDLWSLVVTNPDTTSANIGFTILEELTVTGITPGTAPASGVNRLTIAGTGIASGAVARLTKTGQTDITGATISVAANGTSMSVDFNLAGAALGAWNVVVTNSDTRSKTLANGLNVVSSNMTIAGVSPDHAKVGEQPTVTVQGSGFAAGATVKLTKTGETDINGSSVSVAGAGDSLTAALNLTGASSGAWTLVVTNPNSDHASGAFAIQSIVTVAGITPSSAANSGAAAVTVTGTGFASGAVVKLKKTGQPDLIGTGVVVDPAGTSLTANLGLASAAAGARDVVVENADGGSGTLAGGFTVLQQIGIVSLSPSIGTCGDKRTVTVSGHHFAAGATVKMVGAGVPDIQGSNVNVATGGGSLTAEFDFTGALCGQREVIVTNPDGAASPAFRWFALLMRVTKVDPTEIAADVTPFVLDFDGVGIAPGTTVEMACQGGGDIRSTSTSVPTPEEMTAEFPVEAGDSMGFYMIHATGPDGVLVNTGLFVRVGYIISDMTPRVASPGTSVSAQITGSGFSNGVSAKLRMAGQSDIVGTGVSVVSPSLITASFAIPASAPSGKWTLVLTSPAGHTATYDGALATGMGLGSVSPPQGGAGGTLSVVLRGLGFDANSTVKLTRTGKPDIAGMPPTYVAKNGADYDRLETTFNLWGCEKGRYNVVVTTSGGGTFDLPNGFEIVEPVRAVKTYVVAPYMVRTRKQARITIPVYNEGNVDAYGCLFIQGIPKGVTWELPDFANRPDAVRIVDDGTEVRVAVPNLVVPTASSKQFTLLLTSTNDLELDISVQWAGVTNGGTQ